MIWLTLVVNALLILVGLMLLRRAYISVMKSLRGTQIVEVETDDEKLFGWMGIYEFDKWRHSPLSSEVVLIHMRNEDRTLTVSSIKKIIVKKSIWSLVRGGF